MVQWACITIMFVCTHHYLTCSNVAKVLENHVLGPQSEGKHKARVMLVNVIASSRKNKRNMSFCYFVCVSDRWETSCSAGEVWWDVPLWRQAGPVQESGWGSHFTAQPSCGRSSDRWLVCMWWPDFVNICLLANHLMATLYCKQLSLIHPPHGYWQRLDYI